jgi:hypothetical protein
MTIFLTILAAIIFALMSGLGVLLQVLTLPGTWIIVVVAVLYQGTAMLAGVVQPFNWWVLGAAVALALFAELVEFATCAVGAAAGGARGRGAGGALVGSVIGAVVGIFVFAFIPLLGPLLGALLGAGLGAFIGEVSYGDRSAGQATAPALGAAVGRIAGVAVKILVAAIMWLMLVIDAFV